MKRFPLIAIGLSTIFLIAACASHKPAGAPFRSADDLMTQETIGDVVWAADGLSAVEFDRIFDWKFSKRGYSAAILAVRNRSEEDIRFSWQNVEGAIDPEEVIGKGQRIIPLRLFWWNLTTIVELIVFEGVGIDGLTLSVIGIFDAVAAGNANKQIADDIRRQSVREVVVPPNRPFEGLVYFRGTPTRIRLLCRHGDNTMQVELPWR